MRTPVDASITSFQIGDIRVDRIIEMEIPFRSIADSYANVDWVAFEAVRANFEPWALEPGSNKLIIAIQSYLVRTRRHTILIDTCVGCEKTNSFFPAWHHRADDSWLRRLAAVGIAPEKVDYVFCTHLHSDHCGWNTRLLDGRWIPTFPNAKYIMSREDIEPMILAESGSYANTTFNESVLPVIEAKQAVLVSGDFALDDEIWLESTPGHTRAHAAVHLKSNGQEAIMCGDLIHSPLQCRFIDWQYRIDWNPEIGVATRRRFLETAAASGHLVLTAHFPSPSIGVVRAEGDAWAFDFAT